MLRIYLFLILSILICRSATSIDYYVWGAPIPDKDGYGGNDGSFLDKAVAGSLVKTIMREDSLGIPFGDKREVLICLNGIPKLGVTWEKVEKCVSPLIVWTIDERICDGLTKKEKRIFDGGIPIYMVNLNLEDNLLTVEIMPKLAFYNKRVIITELQRRIYKYTFTLNCSTMNWEPCGLEITYKSE